MARPLRIQYPGAVYHVMNRGNAREPIFKDSASYRLFFKCLSEKTNLDRVLKGTPRPSEQISLAFPKRGPPPNCRRLPAGFLVGARRRRLHKANKGGRTRGHSHCPEWAPLGQDA